ncbi:MAG: rhodanese-like domain-containing protein [Bacteroidia bacterium]|nr:rhodanese-like domain-containing protein [Bacteroidia bacterium]
MPRFLFSAWMLSLMLSAACQQSPAPGSPAAPSAPAAAAPVQPPAPGTALSPAEFQRMLAAGGAQLVDVRTAGELAAGKIQGAAHIDVYDPAFASKAAQLDKQKPVLVYCASGVRSRRAAQMLAAQGYTQVYDLQGGIRFWQSKGLPVVR